MMYDVTWGNCNKANTTVRLDTTVSADFKKKRVAAVKDVTWARIKETEGVGLRTCEYKYEEKEGGRR